MNGIETSWPWLALLLLGAGHGINPGMGWLFAVALGMQEGKGRAVWRALPALALGHALAIGGAVLAAAAIGAVVPPRALKWLVAVVLLGFGVYKLFRNSHPRFGGMRVGMRDLAIWSCLMASAHGAGLMVLPLVVGDQRGAPQVVQEPGHAGMRHGKPLAPAAELERNVAQSDPLGGGAHMAHAKLLRAGPSDRGVGGLMATLVHTLGYLLVTGLIAVLVYEKLGLAALRSVWLNLDLIWAGALIVTAILTPLI
jgi:hypothetical protein